MGVGIPTAIKISTLEDTLSVDLFDGRTISVPLAWYPPLCHSPLLCLN